MHLRALIVGIITLFVLLPALSKLTMTSHQAQSLPTLALPDPSTLPIFVVTPDPAHVSTDQTEDALPELAQAVFVLINEKRVAQGCPALVEDATLTRIALEHSSNMAHVPFFGHAQDGQPGPGQRIRDAGYDWKWYAENIAAGYTTAVEVLDAWLASEGHQRNIYNCTLRDIGIGVYYLQSSPYKYYWTTDFGWRDTPTPLPTATPTVTPTPSPMPEAEATIFPDPLASPTAEPTPIEIPEPFKYLLPAIQGVQTNP